MVTVSLMCGSVMEMETAWMGQMKWIVQVGSSSPKKKNPSASTVYFISYVASCVLEINTGNTWTFLPLGVDDIADSGAPKQESWLSDVLFPLIKLSGFRSPVYHQTHRNVHRIISSAGTPSAVSACLPVATDRFSVRAARMRRTVLLHRAVWSLTGPVATSCASPESGGATVAATARTVLTKRAVVWDTIRFLYQVFSTFLEPRHKWLKNTVLNNTSALCHGPA